jgi:ppGpp synthetase/RelA/SpoT-type nucleotidyltranferase
MKLDMHCEMILDEYREKLPLFEKLRSIALERMEKCLNENKIIVASIDSRIKTEESLTGKLELKGYKYRTLDDITDIVGIRVVTFYNDEVDVISALAEQIFEIDWENTVDKRKMMEIDRFGYMSLHYICRLPLPDNAHVGASLQTSSTDGTGEPMGTPELHEIRFELQMRSVLQHVWANMYHDMGYKTDVEIPREYQRNMSRLAGMLELADEQFSNIRKDITEYRRKVQSLVANGNFDEVPFNGDTFRSFIALKPFEWLVDKMAAINQAEVYEDSLMPYYNVLRLLNMRTIGDVVRMSDNYSESAYQLALVQLAGTGLDILASSVALQNLCIVYILKKGFGVAGLVKMFDTLYGKNDYNAQRADRIFEQAKKVNII